MQRKMMGYLSMKIRLRVSVSVCVYVHGGREFERAIVCVGGLVLGSLGLGGNDGGGRRRRGGEGG